MQDESQIYINAAMKKLSTMTFKELENLSTENYDRLVDRMHKITYLKEEHQDLVATAKKLAEDNFNRRYDYERQLADLLNEIIDCKKLEEDIRLKSTRLTMLSRRSLTKSILDALQAAADKADSESDTVAKAFLNNSIDCDTFINQFLQKKRLAYLRRLKIDRFQLDADK